MNPRNFATIAASMASMVNAGPERYRTSISRSYYGAYLVALAFLEKAGLEPAGSAQKHSGVKQGLLESKDAEVKAIGMSLDGLHEHRKWADYQMDNLKPERQQQAQASLKQAQEIIQGLDTLLASAKFHTIASALKAWANTPGGARWLRPT